MDRETVVSNLSGLWSKEKRDRDQNVVQTSRDRQNLQKILERKAELAVKGEKWPSKDYTKLKQKWKFKNWEKRNSDIALSEVNQEFESQRLQPQQANKWADQAQERQHKLVRRIGNEDQTLLRKASKRLPRNSRMEKNFLRRNRWSKTSKIDELSMHQERNPTTVSQQLTQIQDLQNMKIPCQTQGNFYDHETGNTSEATHVPSEPSAIPSPRTMLCCDSGLKHETQNGTALLDTFLNNPCSRRAIVHNLEQIKEFDILLSGIAT